MAPHFFRLSCLHDDAASAPSQHWHHPDQETATSSYTTYKNLTLFLTRISSSNHSFIVFSYLKCVENWFSASFLWVTCFFLYAVLFWAPCECSSHHTSHPLEMSTLLQWPFVIHCHLNLLELVVQVRNHAGIHPRNRSHTRRRAHTVGVCSSEGDQ